MIHSFPLSQIKLDDSYLVNSFQKEIAYLTSFDCDKLLSFFRQTKKLLPKASSYLGWENTEIRGHTLGHYLSALAQTYASTKDDLIYQRIEYMIDELSLCQLENGYLSAFGEEFFDRVEQGKPVWVPWYTIHKIIAGLNDVYRFTQIPLALIILQKLGDWVFNRTDKWTPELQAKVLQVEYGGMNDCMYELYSFTNQEKHKIAAHKFDELSLFEEIYNKKNVLPNRHANTTIPKFLGALNRYLVLGATEEFYLTACKNFWDMVVDAHSYVTGGNSEWEHFKEPYLLNATRTEANCETCNIYNMLKLTRGLFQITGEKKYADFYEQAFINTILSSQNPSTGMTTYFQPMATGYFKVYSRPFDHFWCCTGTGMENFTKLGDSFYFYETDNLFINLYLSSKLYWKEKDLTLTLITDIPNTNIASFTINTSSDTQAALHFRIPHWSKHLAIKINHQPAAYEIHNGYAQIKRLWKDNDILEVEFEIEVTVTSLPDEANVVSFTYGPLVLSAALGLDSLEESTTGIMVQIPRKAKDIKDYLVISNDKVEDWKNLITQNLIKREGTLEFFLQGTDEDQKLCFTPHYRQHTQRYGIYWQLVEANSEELDQYQKAKQYQDFIKDNTIDSLQLGNDQYELSHHIAGEHTKSGDRDGYHYRYAEKNGWFCYEIQVATDEDTHLQLSYMPGDCKSNFFIYVNDSLLSTEITTDKSWRELIEKTYLLPKELYTKNQTVTVTIQTTSTDCSGRIVSLRTIKNWMTKPDNG